MNPGLCFLSRSPAHCGATWADAFPAFVQHQPDATARCLQELAAEAFSPSIGPGLGVKGWQPLSHFTLFKRRCWLPVFFGLQPKIDRNGSHPDVEALLGPGNTPDETESSASETSSESGSTSYFTSRWSLFCLFQWERGLFSHQSFVEPWAKMGAGFSTCWTRPG